MRCYLLLYSFFVSLQVLHRFKKKMLDFIQHFFLLFIFFLKRKEIIIFEDIIKEKNCLMLTRRKSVEFPVSRQINYRLLKKLTNDES